MRWLFRPTRLAFAAALTLLWLFWPQVERQLPALDDRDEYRVGVAQIQVTPPPRWVPEDIVQKVFDRAGFDDSLSVLDPELSEKVALAFYTHPWIERLQQVRKAYPARVYVDVVYREPVAMVEVVGGGYYPIDRLGHLLPNEDFSAADINRYPVIRNISSVPIGNVGEAWGDPAVTGAAELAMVLTAPGESGQSWWTALGLKSIIAPRRMTADDKVEDLQFRIGTQGGSQIVWGRAPTTQHPSELTVVQKLGRMVEYHHSYHGFDDSPAAFVIDIRHWQGTRRSLLASETTDTSRQ
ncbi:MAG: hypothetical protein R3C59_29215 [Planctomycetaceae bacterium]